VNPRKIASGFIQFGAGPGWQTKGANNSSGGLSLTAAEVSGLLPRDSSIIAMTAMSYNPQAISGKKFAFIKSTGSIIRRSSSNKPRTGLTFLCLADVNACCVGRHNHLTIS